MTPEVVWTWAAEADMQRFFTEWEDRQDGSCVKLLLRVEKATELLLRFPHMAPAWKSPVRRLVIQRTMHPADLAVLRKLYFQLLLRQSMAKLGAFA